MVDQMTYCRGCISFLFHIFYHINTIPLVLNDIFKAQPENIFIAVNVLEKNAPNKARAYKQKRIYLDKIDWNNTASTLLFNKNSGCKRPVSSAIDGFFFNDIREIIPMDDCVPDQSFFFLPKNSLRGFGTGSIIIQVKTR